jgi:hypothetical protein
MKQTIVIDRPPIYDKIAALFPIEGKSVLFAWGEQIYNPEGIVIPKELIAHELIHGERQGSDEANIMAWWEKYLVDPQFRFNEELPAHRAEYLALVKRHSNKRHMYLQYVAEKLAAPLYGNLVSIVQAKEAIERVPVVYKPRY